MNLLVRLKPYSNFIFKLSFTVSLLFTPFTASSTSYKLNVPKASTLPILAEETDNTDANMIAFVGGSGLRNGDGRSRNFLVKQKGSFVRAGLNYYLFPNWDQSERAGYSLRASNKRARRILRLIELIKKRNAKPIWLVGYSRGSVDAAYFAKNYPDEIKGIVVMSGIYKNESRKAKFYSMELIIGEEIKTSILITHHKFDTCHVTKFQRASLFYRQLKAPKKHLLSYTGGQTTGRACGPLHHHGFEGIEQKVSQEVASWISANSK